MHFLTEPYAAAIIFSFLVAGAVKGLVGIGLPTILLVLNSQFLDPRLAISIALIPIAVTNAWQVFHSGEIVRAFKEYLPFLLVSLPVVWFTATFSTNIPNSTMYLLTGVAVVGFVAASVLSNGLNKYRPNNDLFLQAPSGLATGLIGGATSIWAPAIIIFLSVRGAVKDEFVRASGLLIFLSCIPLTAGYFRSGALTPELATTSLALLAPTILGFQMGAVIRSRLSERTFWNVLLISFLLMGGNLIRKGVIG